MVTILEVTTGDLSTEQTSALKAKGLIKYTGEGRIPQPSDISERNGVSGLTKICMNFICRDRFCRYERRCNQKHITNVNDFTVENKVKLQNFVTNHANFVMANPGTPPS
jgi:hypothetical protein